MSSARPLGGFGLRSGILLLAAGSSVTAEAQETVIKAGVFAASATACYKAADADVVISNGYAVASPGETCRVVSRTSSGGYYPIFNQRCTGGAGGDLLTDLIVSAPDRIAVRSRIDGTTIAYRHCPTRIAAPDAH